MPLVECSEVKSLKLLPVLSASCSCHCAVLPHHERLLYF